MISASPAATPSRASVAIGLAFDEQADQLEDRDAQAGHPDARREFVQAYLSAAHRDDPGGGCPAAGFGTDVARDDDEAARRAYADGIGTYARWLARDGGEDLAAVSTLVGAIVLARATAGTELSDRILAAARRSLTAEDGRDAP
jgi:TetR/AcrR family transcriptional repressor of nem operon